MTNWQSYTLLSSVTSNWHTKGFETTKGIKIVTGQSPGTLANIKTAGPQKFGIKCSHTITCFYPNRSKLRQALATILPGNDNGIVKSSPLCKLRSDKRRETGTTGWRFCTYSNYLSLSTLESGDATLWFSLTRFTQAAEMLHAGSFKFASIDSVSFLSPEHPNLPAGPLLNGTLQFLLQSSHAVVPWAIHPDC